MSFLHSTGLRLAFLAFNTTLAFNVILPITTYASEELQDIRSGESSESFTGMATYFGGLGVPAGGCGLPQYMVDSQNFVALNVQNANPSIPGEFAQGRNCGRWVEVTLTQFCYGPDNSERWNTSNCEGGFWKEGPLTGKKAYFVVTDSCNDGNVWCRYDRYHLDISTTGLEQFGLNTNTWRNPRISWRYVDAPNYSGDIKLGFARGASRNWPALMITNLERGLHKIEQWVGGQWVEQKMFLTLGHIYTLTPTGNEEIRIRLYDAYDQPIQGGRVYRFAFPQDCCGQPFNPISYTTE